jgi:hypothetical protein
MGRFYILILIVSFSLSFTACKKDQPAPAYVYIPEIQVNSNYTINGSNSSEIVAAKVFNGNQLIGVYELPINVPIISTGNTLIQCLPLIENNGLASNLLNYIFYTGSSNEVFLEETGQDTIYPIVNYIPSSLASYWYEDFDGIGFDFVPGENSDAPLFITDQPDEVFQGTGSGKFDLSADTAYSKYLTEENFQYISGTPAFVELNYKNNQSFFFSLILRPASGDPFKLPVYQFNSTINEEGEIYWNKIYIDIATSLNGINGIDSFDICFEMTRDISVSDPIVLIDNVKVIKGK